MIWVRKTENAGGNHTDENGTRFLVEWCVGIVGSSPEREGYERHHSVAAALEAWKLSTYQPDEMENLNL